MHPSPPITNLPTYNLAAETNALLGRLAAGPPVEQRACTPMFAAVSAVAPWLNHPWERAFKRHLAREGAQPSLTEWAGFKAYMADKTDAGRAAEIEEAGA